MLTGLNRADELMARLFVVPASVPGGRAVAAADFSADEAHPQVDRAGVLRDAGGAGSGSGVDHLDRGEVVAATSLERALEDDPP